MGFGYSFAQEDFRDLCSLVCGFWIDGNCEREKFNIINIFIDVIVYTIKSIKILIMWRQFLLQGQG